MTIPIKKELSYPAFAVWGTKRGKKVFFFDQFDSQETTNSVDKILTDLRDSISNPSTTTPFYSLEKKGTVCIFSIYISIDDWLGRSGYYAVSFLMHSNQEFKGSSIVEALKYFSAIYFESAIKDSSHAKRISEYTDEEANKVLFQIEFIKKGEYHLVPTLDSQFYNGTEKAYFNYDNETEIDTFFKNRNHTDIEKYQTIYFVPKKEETQTALTCIYEIPAFKPVEKPKTELTAKEEAFLNPPSKFQSDEKNGYLIEDQTTTLEESEQEKTSQKETTENNKVASNKTEEAREVSKTPTEQKPKEKEPSFFDKLKEKKEMIILAVLIPVALITIGVAIWKFTKDGEVNKTVVAENVSGFTQEQLDKFKADVDNIAAPILDTNWKWSTTEYNQIFKDIAEKDSLLPSVAIGEKEKENLRKAQSYSETTKTKLKSASNSAITKKANELIASTKFDHLIAKELYDVINSFNIQYADTAKLRKYTSVAFRVYQAKEIIKENRLPVDKNVVEGANGDFKKASIVLNDKITSILKTDDYNFLNRDQRCHLTEWSNILIARQHKDNIDHIVEWVVNTKYPPASVKAIARAQQLREFLKSGTCNN